MANPGAPRSQRNSAVPNYIDTNTPGKSTQHVKRSQEKATLRQGNIAEMHQPPPQPNDDTTASVPETATEQSIQDVSPQLIAAITETVRKELLKQSANAEDDKKMTPLQPVVADSVKKPTKTATVEDELEAPPMQQQPSNISQSSTSSPPSASRIVYTPPSPTQASRPHAPRSESSRSPPRSPSEKPTGVRFSDRPLPRPSMGRSNMELSTIDQKWGRLFDGEGNPTQRLGQFLRGLANHIVSVVGML
jgi:hypothetical protein